MIRKASIFPNMHKYILQAAGEVTRRNFCLRRLFRILGGCLKNVRRLLRVLRNLSKKKQPVRRMFPVQTARVKKPVGNFLPPLPAKAFRT